MVLEIAVKFMKPEPRTAVELDVVPKLYHRRAAVHDLYTVHVDSTQILTVATRDDNIAGKWLTEVLKSTASNTKPLNPNPEFRPDSIFVGLIADMDYEVYCPGGLQDHPYELLTVCVGSHCLMYRLPWPDYPGTPKVVKAFFENPRVVVLGRDMAKVANKLKKTHGIEIRKAVDLNELAIRGMKRDDLDLGRYEEIQICAKMVLEVSVEEIAEPEVTWTPSGSSPDNEAVASKWLKEVLRSKASNNKPPLPGAPTTFSPDSIFVGLVAEQHSPFYVRVVLLYIP